MPDETEKTKIIIDEDWKSQVQREKETLAAKEAKEPQAPPAESSESKAAEATSARRSEAKLPPATLSTLLSTLATQAMFALGQFPHPTTGKAELDFDQAQHFIDSLQMLQDKTAGNRTAEESLLLENILHELRMAFITLQKRK